MRPGYLAFQCRNSISRLYELQQENQLEENKNLFAIRNKSIAKRAPTVCASIRSLNGSAKLKVLPDTGADVTAADVRPLKALNEDVNGLSR